MLCDIAEREGAQILVLGYHGHGAANAVVVDSQGSRHRLTMEREAELPVEEEVLVLDEYTGLEKAKLGSVAEHVLIHAPCTVMICKTQGRRLLSSTN